MMRHPSCWSAKHATKNGTHTFTAQLKIDLWRFMSEETTVHSIEQRLYDYVAKFRYEILNEIADRCGYSVDRPDAERASFSTWLGIDETKVGAFTGKLQLFIRIPD